MMIVAKARTYGDQYEVTVKMDKAELDLLVWSMEAFVAKSGWQSIHGFALHVLDVLKSAYKMAFGRVKS